MKMKLYLIVLSLLASCLWGTGAVRAQSASRSMTRDGQGRGSERRAVTGALGRRSRYDEGHHDPVPAGLSR